MVLWLVENNLHFHFVMKLQDLYMFLSLPFCFGLKTISEYNIIILQQFENVTTVFCAHMQGSDNLSIHSMQIS